MSEQYKIEYEFILEHIRHAGVLTKQRFGRVPVEYKESDVPFDVITETDRTVDEYLKEQIRARFPTDVIHSEEGSDAATAERVWALDPVDGSSNYVRSIPHFAVCLALVVNNTPVAGAVYDPLVDELFSFERGVGAFLNGMPITPSRTQKLEGSTVLLTVGSREKNREWGLALYEKLLTTQARVRNFGSSGLDVCYLAAGRVDAVVYGGVGLLDIAAAVGIAREVKCVIQHFDTGEEASLLNEPQRIVAAAPEFAERLRTV